MLAARACLLRSPFTYKSVVSKAQASKQGQIARFFSNETRARTGARVGEIPVAKKIPVTTPFAVGHGVAAGAAFVGLGSLAYYGLGMSSEAGALEQSLLWPQYVKDRIRDTYMFVAGSLGVAAASTVGVYRSPAILRLFNAQGFAGFILPLVGLIAVGAAMRSIPYEPGFGSKHLIWMLHSGLVGAIIAPLLVLGGPVFLRAAMMTAGVVGGLSTIAVCAPCDKFMNIGAPLGIALGALMASCLGSLFLPPTSLAGASLYSFVLYGGLVIFSLLLLNETQTLMKNAQALPYYAQFDPINASSAIFMSIINIFIRFVQITAMSQGGRRK